MQKEELMICDRCQHIFHIKDAAIQYKDYAGVSIKEKKCPECNGSFHSIQLPGDLEKYLFINDDNRYYEYQ